MIGGRMDGITCSVHRSEGLRFPHGVDEWELESTGWNDLESVRGRLGGWLAMFCFAYNRSCTWDGMGWDGDVLSPPNTATSHTLTPISGPGLSGRQSASMLSPDHRSLSRKEKSPVQWFRAGSAMLGKLGWCWNVRAGVRSGAHIQGRPGEGLPSSPTLRPSQRALHANRQ